MGSRVQRGETASGPLVFWQDSDADLPKCVANDEGEDDCSLTTSDTKTGSLKPGTVWQIESRLIQQIVDHRLVLIGDVGDPSRQAEHQGLATRRTNRRTHSPACRCARCIWAHQG